MASMSLVIFEVVSSLREREKEKKNEKTRENPRKPEKKKTFLPLRHGLPKLVRRGELAERNPGQRGSLRGLQHPGGLDLAEVPRGRRGQRRDAGEELDAFGDCRAARTVVRRSRRRHLALRDRGKPVKRRLRRRGKARHHEVGARDLNRSQIVKLAVDLDREALAADLGVTLKDDDVLVAELLEGRGRGETRGPSTDNGDALGGVAGERGGDSGVRVEELFCWV